MVAHCRDARFVWNLALEQARLWRRGRAMSDAKPPVSEDRLGLPRLDDIEPAPDVATEPEADTLSLPEDGLSVVPRGARWMVAQPRHAVPPPGEIDFAATRTAGVGEPRC